MSGCLTRERNGDCGICRNSAGEFTDAGGELSGIGAVCGSRQEGGSAGQSGCVGPNRAEMERNEKYGA